MNDALFRRASQVGVVQPLAEIVEAVRGASCGCTALVHTDASQAVGKIAVDVGAMGVDLLTVAGHKLYAPKGVGALYIRKGTPCLTPLMHGGGQECGRRAGTENVILSVAMGRACEIAAEHLPDFIQRTERLRW